MIKLPLVGAAYKMQSQSISCQNCINWYPQTIEYPNGSRVAALMPTPGLKKVFSGDVAATRCLYVLSNGALLAVIGKVLYHSKANKFELTEVGSISALGTVRIADNGQIALIVNGTYTYSLNLKTLSLERLSGSTIPRSTHVLFLDGRFVVNKANTGQFYWSDLYSTTVNALSYATAESTPDNITAIITFNHELWLFGAQSVERYYGTGSSNSPFSRLSGGAMAFGCVAPDSIIALSTGVIWLGVSEFGGNQIVMSAGGLPERISTHALEEEISSYSKTSNASAYAYQQEGHVFYVISFPTANVTFCFDVSTGLWHQRSFTNVQGLHERHRSQHHAYFNNAHIVGDYRNGKLYQLDNNTFTDDGELILRERTAQAVITDKKLTRFNQLQIVCETGFFGEVKKDSPKPLPISCTDAISSVTLNNFSNQGDYLFYINDNTVLDLSKPFYSDDNKTFTNALAELNIKLELLNGDFSEAIPDEDGNVFGEIIRVTNLSNTHIRIRVDINTQDVNKIPRQLDPFNPAASIHNRIPTGNGVMVLFCLSPLEIDPKIYPPYAVLKTNATWGMVIPASVTVNGTNYKGSLYGDLANILAHQYNIYTGFERIYADSEGDTDLVRVVFAGDVFAENLKINVEFLAEINVEIDDSQSYPENETLTVSNGYVANFNIGKLACEYQTTQRLTSLVTDQNFIYKNDYQLRVSTTINGESITSDKKAGESIDDPAGYCSTAESPQLCINMELLANLSKQWNLELIGENIGTSNYTDSLDIFPINGLEKFVVQPTQEIGVEKMAALGYAIPRCFEPS